MVALSPPNPPSRSRRSIVPSPSLPLCSLILRFPLSSSVLSSIHLYPHSSFCISVFAVPAARRRSSSHVICLISLVIYIFVHLCMIKEQCTEKLVAVPCIFLILSSDRTLLDKKTLLKQCKICNGTEEPNVVGSMKKVDIQLDDGYSHYPMRNRIGTRYGRTHMPARGM